MAIFCTQCGTPAAQDALFCENCGGSLRRPALASQSTVAQAAIEPSGSASSARPTVGASRSGAGPLSKKVLYGTAAVVVLVIGGGAAAYLALKTPDPTATRLLAAIKPADAKILADRFKAELCLSNLNYSGDRFNVEQFDRSTQDWMNALVAAGLFAPGVPVESGGLFGRTFIQYNSTPELDRWREGTRLCLAKSVTLADVVDIGQPTDEQVQPGASKSPTVKARLSLQGNETAPWLADTTVRRVLTARLSNWDYQEGRLQKKVDARFVFRDGAWTTAPVQARAEREYGSPRRGVDTAAASKPGWFASLGNLFSFGGNPLKGTWQLDKDASDFPGFGLPGLPGSTLTFTDDAIESAGGSIRCTFEVEGDRVKVTPAGSPESMIIVLKDKNTATIDAGLIKVVLKRIS
jgi:hypothetical protein